MRLAVLGILGSPAPPYIANSQLRQTAGGPCAIVLHSLCSSPTPIPTSGRHQPETALGQIPGAPRSTRPGGSWSPQGPRGRISLRFDRYFPIRSGFPPPWTLLPRQPGSRDSLPPPGSRVMGASGGASPRPLGAPGLLTPRGLGPSKEIPQPLGLEAAPGLGSAVF